jgi:uncharacterized protein (TIGR00730 family)
MLGRILKSPTYVRADQDIDFIARDEVRPTRLHLEFLKPEVILTESGIQGTIVVFGGTRIVEEDEAKRNVAKARERLKKKPEDPHLQRQLMIAERIQVKSQYYEVAREFGRLVGESGEGPEDCRVVAITGGGPGLMEAANRGAYEIGAKSIGLNIILPMEQIPNPFITPDLCFQFRYFAIRKMHFMMRARALVVFPGGFGTMDELFEVLTLIQTQKVDPLPVILVGEAYWRRAFDVQFLADEGVISLEDIKLFSYAETAHQIWEKITGWYEKNDLSLFE